MMADPWRWVLPGSMTLIGIYAEEAENVCPTVGLTNPQKQLRCGHPTSAVLLCLASWPRPFLYPCLFPLLKELRES